MDPLDDKTLENLQNHPDWLKRVLVVDDDKIALEALKMTIEAAGLETHTAMDGKEAIKQLKESEFAAIVCDRDLPEADGLQVLKKALELQPEMIRLVVTGATNLQEAAELVNITQISHFILKPWDYVGLTRAVVSSVEKFNLQRENKALNNILQKELVIGGRVQNLLLEGRFPSDIPGIDIKGLTIPSRFLDADFYEFYRPDDHLLDVVVGDVMGKGLPAALVGLAAKTQFSRFASPQTANLAHKKPKGWHIDLLGPDEVLQHVKNELHEPLKELEQFVALFYCRFNFKEQTLAYVECGLQKPIHFRRKKQNAELLKGGNFPLGIGDADERYSVEKVSFNKGDLLVFYSDGITEAKSLEGEFFGVERLTKLIEEHSEKSAGELVGIVKDEVSAFTSSDEFEDDFTLIVFKILAATPFEFRPPECVAKFNSRISQLNAVRKFVETFCLQVSEKTSSIVHLMQLAVDEIFCNIVNHSFDGENGHEIIIQGNYDENGLVFEIMDQGEPFDPSEIDHPDMSGGREGGFGFYIVKEIADKIVYQRKKTANGWNCIRIIKKLNFEGKVMEISHYRQDNINIVTLEGDNLDAKETPNFKSKITKLIEQEDARRIVLDLSNLNFIDSTGLGGFLSMLRLLNGRSGDLKLANMTKQIKTIFELVCMHKIFDMYNSVDEAVNAFEKESAPSGGA